MNDQQMRFFGQRDWPTGGFAMHITLEDSRGQRALMQPAEFKIVEHRQEDMQVSPSIHFTNEDAQALLDELYRMGLRPSQANDGEGVKAHLADMRKIVSKKLGVEL